MDDVRISKKLVAAKALKDAPSYVPAKQPWSLRQVTRLAYILYLFYFSSFPNIICSPIYAFSTDVLSSPCST